MKRIIVNNVSKKFKIGFKKNQSALARFVSSISGVEPKKEFWALRNISFSASAGEIIGIIGPNGSGKSTLLRIIAGIYDKNEGEIRTDGKIISLINLNIGLQDRLSMKDNIYLCCLLYGLKEKDAKRRFYQIVEFAELNNFTNTKVYQFSDGMEQRLAFSIAIHCDPDILLLDEAFAVGDEKFRRKGIEAIKNLAKNGTTILLVTHYLNIFEEYMERYCDKVISICNGKIVENTH